GLKEGEEVVTSANFLIDSESQLQAALGSFVPPPPGAGSAGAMNAPQTNIELTTDPAPPRKGSNTIRVKLSEANGAPISGAEVTITFEIRIVGIAGIKNVTETSAPEIGAPFASLSFTRIVLLPFRGGAGSVVSSIFVCGAFIAPADPAPGGGGTKDPRAACSWLSESIKKFAEVTTS